MAGFRAFPADANNEPLAGALPCMWTSSNTAVADITSDPTSNVMTFQFVTPGMATIHLALGNFTTDIPVTFQ